jgi:FtsZ-binding cell division protein ZapB
VNVLTIYLDEQNDIDLKNEITSLTKKSATQSKNAAHQRNELQNRIDKLQKDVANFEKQEKMLAMLERMQCFITTDHDVLSKKYPKGYFLFASDKYVVIPPRQKAKFDLSLDWENSLIKATDESFILVLLRNLRYYPTEILVENLRPVRLGILLRSNVLA